MGAVCEMSAADLCFCFTRCSSFS